MDGLTGAVAENLPLYGAFVVGFLLGRVVSYRSPWISRATLGTVVVLVALFGATLAGVPVPSLLETIPVALGLVAVVATATVATAIALRRLAPPPPDAAPPGPGRAERIPLPPILIGALVLGYFLGRTTAVPASTAIPWVLYALVALVAFGLELHLADLRTLWIPVVAAPVGAAVGAAVMVFGVGVAPPVALATTFGMAWYSLAGPLVGARAGAAIGLLAFLVNFFREDVTMLAAPIVGRRIGGEALAALGGASSMDTNLFLISRYGGPRAAGIALATGLIFTVAASLLLPALLALP